MSDRFAAHRPPTIRNLSARTRRFTIGAAPSIPALLIGLPGLVADKYPLTTQNVSAACRAAGRYAQHPGHRVVVRRG